MQCRYYGSKVILFVVRYVCVVTVNITTYEARQSKNRVNFVGEKCQGTLARVPVLRVLVYILYTGI